MSRGFVLFQFSSVVDREGIEAPPGIEASTRKLSKQKGHLQSKRPTQERASLPYGLFNWQPEEYRSDAEGHTRSYSTEASREKAAYRQKYAREKYFAAAPPRLLLGFCPPSPAFFSVEVPSLEDCELHTSASYRGHLKQLKHIEEPNGRAANFRTPLYSYLGAPPTVA